MVKGSVEGAGAGGLMLQTTTPPSSCPTPPCLRVKKVALKKLKADEAASEVLILNLLVGQPHLQQLVVSWTTECGSFMYIASELAGQRDLHAVVVATNGKGLPLEVNYYYYYYYYHHYYY